MPSKIITSTAGRNAEGRPLVSPDSVITYMREGDSREYRSLAVDTVSISMFPLWNKEVLGVTIPVDSIYNWVPLSDVLVRHWVKSEIVGGLVFPRQPLDLESRDPFVQIRKHDEKAALFYAKKSSKTPFVLSMKVNISIFVCRRELLPSVSLQPFDARIWNPVSYVVWCSLYSTLPPIMEEECAFNGDARLPSGACSLFRRMMHTHFADFGYVFGTLFWEFGLGAHLCKKLRKLDHLRNFMREVLTDVFLVYNAMELPPSMPALFNPVTLEAGQRICGKCLAYMLGSGQMLRCPCAQVYYCDAACQKADWKVHRKVCGFAAKCTTK